jgi:hypothetical protein
MSLMLGGLMILVGFLSLIRYRFVRARRRLSPAAAIRSHGSASAGLKGYRASDGGSSIGPAVSMLVMVGGGVVLLAGVLA